MAKPFKATRTCRLCGAIKPIGEMHRAGIVVGVLRYRDEGAVYYECKDTDLCEFTQEMAKAAEPRSPVRSGWTPPPIWTPGDAR